MINDRNKWISIIDNQDIPGPGGQIVSTATTVWEGWAAIWPVGAKEARENMRTGATVTHNIRILHRFGVDSAMQVLFNNRIFDIKGLVNFNEDNLFLDLVCEETF